MREPVRLGHRVVTTVLLAGIVTATGGCSPDDPTGSEDGVDAQRAAAEQAADAVIRCLEDRGWDPSVDSSGNMNVEHPSEQDEQFIRDFRECQQMFALPPPTVGEAEAERLYDKMIKTTECLRAHGWPAPEPQSREATVAAMVETGGLAPWTPYSHLDSTTSTSELERIEQVCPRTWPRDESVFSAD